MEEFAEISIEYPDPETIEIMIEPADTEGASQFGSSGLQAAKGDILRSVFGIEAILRDEAVWL